MFEKIELNMIYLKVYQQTKQKSNNYTIYICYVEQEKNKICNKCLISHVCNEGSVSANIFCYASVDMMIDVDIQYR